MNINTLNDALKQFEIVEANLVKLERLWGLIFQLIPSGLVFGTDEEHEDLCRKYKNVLNELPSINGWKPTSLPANLNNIAQSRLDAMEIDEITVEASVEDWIESPGRELKEYRFLLTQKRRQLVRDAVFSVIREIDNILKSLSPQTNDKERFNDSVVNDPMWSILKVKTDELNVLIGDSIKRPKCWFDMQRHLHFGLICDLWSIEQSDWPDIKNFISTAIYTDDEPIPVQVKDLDDIVSIKPSGKVTTKLSWEKITAEDFERLIYCLISSEANYENPEWLLKTMAPDRGRDLSAYRVTMDNLSGVTRKRVIFQCKHWLSKSINLSDIVMVKEEIKLWEPPRIDVLVIVTSGRFTSDAVAHIEKNNQSDTALVIEMWPDSHLERLIAMRPYLIAEFSLR